ncbi:WD repeat-containing protein 43-like isoform X2 [Portunus trituberculatus]|uniref:WD repeat-containing protein 43-like isoform X2 n=1 Tax=Portunus trituberculatus TaxID=210409 RepID=UPI001E1CB836|nr:WD repeat-containing protein 43-like isoform X2 [Portunus trituberculatus]
MNGKYYNFSPSGEKLSQVGPDGMVRVWDTATGVLDHEYQPASHLMAKPSCIRYSPQINEKKTKKARGDEGSSVLAVATLQGTVLVYSPEKRELLATLDHSQPQAVVDLAWLNPSVLFTLSADNTLVKWNVFTGQKKECVEVKGGTSLCVLNVKNLCIAKSRIEHLFLKKAGGVKVKKNFTGHTSQVAQLLPLSTESSPARYFLSCSTDDRYVYAWDTSSEGEEPVASFLVGGQVAGLEAVEVQNNTISVAVTTLKGFLVLFTQHLNGHTNNTVVKRTGRLQILQEGKQEKVTVPIIAAHFCGDLDHTLIVAYGNASMLKFERISVKEITGEKKLLRAAPAPSVSKKSALAKTVTPKVTRDTTVVGPGHLTIAQADAPVRENKRKQGDEDGTLALPMDERLNALVLNKPTAATQVPKTDNQIHLLLQGLHSKDGRILQSILSCGDETMVANTVRRLPTPAVVPLLKHLRTLFMGKGHKNAAFVTWVRLVLYHHMSHLSTLPNRQELLRPFYSISASRVATFMQLTELHARLDLSLTHVATKHKDAKQAQVEPSALLIYREEDSDIDEDIEVPGVGVSESEDNWEELSDFGELNGHSDSDFDEASQFRSSSSSTTSLHFTSGLCIQAIISDIGFSIYPNR